VIPATACAEFSLTPSSGQRLLLLGSHGAVPLLLLFANTGWLVWAALAGAVLVHCLWQWRRLDRRTGWRLRVDGDRFALHSAGGDALPVACRLAYRSSRMLVLRLEWDRGRRDLVLLGDGYEPEQWRQLQCLARDLGRGARLRDG